MPNGIKPFVLDTNVLLDLLVFNDPDISPLRIDFLDRQLHWISTPAMRDELERVLGYPKITLRMAFYQVNAADVLLKFDHYVTLVEPAPRALAVCKDPDDQKFIDLAVTHRATLLSKDQAVLCLHKRLLAGGVITQSALTYVAKNYPL